MANPPTPIIRNLEDFAGIASDWFWETDAEHRFTYFSSRMQEVTQILPERVLGTRRDLIAGAHSDDPKWLDHLADLRAHRPFKDFEYRIRRDIGGEELWLRVAGKPRFDKDGRFLGYRGTGHDITRERLTIQRLMESRDALEKRNRELDEAQAALQRIADEDALTGLLNRRAFSRDLAAALADDTGDVALLHVDLDRFKWINDSMGHPMGDWVLQAVSERILPVVGDLGRCYRVGGDEFMVLLAMSEDDDRTGWIADSIIETICGPIAKSGNVVNIGASVGIAGGVGGKVSPDQLIAQADMALYQAKKAGRNQVGLVTPALQSEMQARRTLAAELRKAVIADDFVPYFQPQVHVGTSAVVGAEALVRWTHPQLGVLPPGEFLDVAAELGLMAALDRAMLCKALGTAAQLKAAGLVLPSVSVNVSAARLADPELAKDVDEMWQDRSCQLCIELVETLYFDDVMENARIAGNLKALRALGVRIEIDDFGSARASLTGLLEIRPHRIKIDRKLVQAAAKDHVQRSIVGAIFDMASNLGIGAMAEGVETNDDIAVLRKMGCDVFQGYAFAAPLDATALADFIADRHRNRMLGNGM